ncbi:MAG: GNAT family N-acetyltransferase [Bdellovibrionota bacterium]
MRFVLFNENHMDLLLAWLAKPHVRNNWQEEGDRARIWEKYRTLPDRGVHPFVIEDPEPIGYIQYYEASKVGGGWWPDEKPGAFGIDLLIGDESKTGQGLGPEIIEKFLEFVCEREKNVTSFIIDPDPKNERAVKAFEKAGFVREAEITTPGGAALLMRKRTTSRR